MDIATFESSRMLVGAPLALAFALDRTVGGLGALDASGTPTLDLGDLGRLDLDVPGPAGESGVRELTALAAGPDATRVPAWIELAPVDGQLSLLAIWTTADEVAAWVPPLFSAAVSVLGAEVRSWVSAAARAAHPTSRGKN